MPPRHPDRAVYSMTILLAFYVLGTTVSSSIPKTDKIVLLNLYVTLMIIIGSLITCYFCVVAEFADDVYGTARVIKIFYFGDVSVMRYCDGIAFCCFGFIIIFVHVTLFGAMMAHWRLHEPSSQISLHNYR